MTLKSKIETRPVKLVFERPVEVPEGPLRIIAAVDYEFCRLIDPSFRPAIVKPYPQPVLLYLNTHTGNRKDEISYKVAHFIATAIIGPEIKGISYQHSWTGDKTHTELILEIIMDRGISEELKNPPVLLIEVLESNKIKGELLAGSTLLNNEESLIENKSFDLTNEENKKISEELGYGSDSWRECL
jgi:hypothetical protein